MQLNKPFCALLKETLQLKKDFITKWGYKALEASEKVSEENYAKLYGPESKTL